MKKIISILLLFTFGLSSCEKDDICDANTPTTPRLVITFYSNASPDVLQKVVNLRVVGEGAPDENGVVFNESSVGDAKYLSNSSTVSIPLKTDADTVTYKFIFNSGDTTGENTDILTFNYTRTNEYVSRACGFKTTFKLSPTEPFVVTQPVPDDGNWMKIINVVEPNIETENETHIKIYF
jgi:hypothetical protein